MNGLMEQNNGISWSQILRKYENKSEGKIEGAVFKGKSLIGGGQLEGKILENCRFLNCSIPHFTFKDCLIKDCQFLNVRFRLKSWKLKGEMGGAIGSLFDHSVLERCIFEKVDFVMCSIIATHFPNSSITQCDFRNVAWTKKTKIDKWLDIKGIQDPFEKATMKDNRFGHPFANIMALPYDFMIPANYASIWKHMSEPQRAFVKIGYMMGEPPETVFRSAV